MFGAKIAPFVESGAASFCDFCDFNDSTRWTTYEYGGDAFRVHVERGRIVSVACYERCELDNTNLIGLEYDSALQLLKGSPAGEADVIFIDDEPQQVYEFEEAGAQVWVSDGTVVTIFCDDGT